MGASSIGPSVTSLSQRLTIGLSSPAYFLLRQDERKQIDGIQADLKGVENTWKWIEALLADAEEKQIHEQCVRLWLRDLRDLAYKIEDLRDVCEYEVAARKVEASKAASSSDGEVCRSTTRPLSPLVDASFREQVARDLETINREFDAIAKRKEALGLIEKADGQKHFVKDDFSWREPTGHVPTDPLFLGREREMEELRRVLLADHVENVEVIAVIGMGGAGKTTLAQHAYKNAQIKSEFEKIGWVYVSNSFDGIHLTKAIIETFSGNSSPDQPSPLQSEVIRLVKDRKVLLVMDDVWTAESCESVVALLSGVVKKGSKILITTRLPEVAAKARPINLESLSEDHGWYLLKKHAFPNRGDDVDNLEELEEIGKGIVQKCKGLPLSIKLLGRLLCSKGNDEDKWREVLESNLLDFQEVREAKLILGSLYLSYLYLSPKLKSCFKHCAIYPNNTVSPSHLKHSWMAYDLVKNWKEATECLTELASRSLLELAPLKNICCMHDHIYDLARFVLEEMHGYLDYFVTYAECPIELDFSGCRHASLDLRGFSRAVINLTLSNVNTLQISSKYNLDGAFAVHLSQVQSLRELNMDGYYTAEFTSYDGYRNYLKCLRILSIGTSGIPLTTYIPGWLTQLYNLRYLNLSSSNVEYLPDEVCDLVNLRWLNLERSEIKYLPESISRLVNLQELNLHSCKYLEALPESIISLTKLTILNLFGTPVSYMPKGFGALTELQDLRYFIIDSTQAGLAELKNMKHLEGNILINNLCEVVSEEDAAQAGLASKKGLRQLHLCWHKKALLKGISSLLPVDAYPFGHRIYTKRQLDEKFLLEKGNEEKIAQHEERVFEQLRPHHNIETILICKYSGFKLPSWMGDVYFTKLTSIALDGIHYCTSVSPIDQLPSLLFLTLSCIDSLEDLFPKSCIEPVDIKIMDPTTEKRLLSFPKLRNLTIDRCNSLKLLPLYKFSSLRCVFVSDCMKLEQMEPSYDITCLLKRIIIFNCPKFHFSLDPHFPQTSWKLYTLSKDLLSLLTGTQEIPEWKMEGLKQKMSWLLQL